MDDLILGDCLTILPTLAPDSVAMIYLDPPWSSGVYRQTRFAARFGSTFATGDLRSCLEWLRQVLVECRRVLRESGSIWCHVGPQASHHVRLMLDEEFGAGGYDRHCQGFRAEVIWHTQSGGGSRRWPARRHSTLYWYSRGSTWTYHPETIRSPLAHRYGYPGTRVDDDGHPYSEVLLGDVWNDLPVLGALDPERVGYPTQKPVALLERVISLTTNPGDLILDPTCGSATTLVAARALDRRAIGIDIAPAAIAIARARLSP